MHHSIHILVGPKNNSTAYNIDDCVYFNDKKNGLFSKAFEKVVAHFSTEFHNEPDALFSSQSWNEDSQKSHFTHFEKQS